MTLEELEGQCAAVPEDAALPLSTTSEERDAIRVRRQVLNQRLAVARDALARLASLPATDADERWLSQLARWRDALGDELIAIAAPIRDPRALGVRANVTLSLKCIDFGPRVFTDTGYDLTNLRLGELMVASGYDAIGADPDRNYGGVIPWFGSVPEVEKRIADARGRRAAAEAALADALMDDDERTKRDAESKARRDALNALPTRKVRGDGSQYDKYPDGRRVEVTR